MPTWKGRWTASVSQDFEIEAETEAEFHDLLAEEMSPRNVVELQDFASHDITKDGVDDEG